MERQYIGARYVPKFADPIEWNDQTSYEALTIVTYMGSSYTSKKAVPAGVKPTDSNYWVATGNYNAQLEAYRQEVVAVAQKTTENSENIDAKFEFMSGKTVVMFGDSYMDNESFIEGLKSIFKKTTFVSYAHGGTAMLNRQGIVDLEQQYAKLKNSGVIPDIILMMYGNNDCYVQASENPDKVDMIGTFDSSSANWNTNTSMAHLQKVLADVKASYPNCRVGFIPFCNLSTEGYFLMAKSALYTQLNCVHYWADVNMLWQENFGCTDLSNTLYWNGGHPTNLYYDEIMLPIIAGWLSSGMPHYTYPIANKCLIVDDINNLTAFNEAVKSKINKMNHTNTTIINYDISGKYQIYTLKSFSNPTVIDIFARSFGQDFFYVYYDVNGMKFYDGTNFKGLNWV